MHVRSRRYYLHHSLKDRLDSTWQLLFEISRQTYRRTDRSACRRTWQDVAVWNKTYGLEPCGGRDVLAKRLRPSVVGACSCSGTLTPSKILRFREMKIQGSTNSVLQLRASSFGSDECLLYSIEVYDNTSLSSHVDPSQLTSLKDVVCCLNGVTDPRSLVAYIPVEGLLTRRYTPSYVRASH